MLTENDFLKISLIYAALSQVLANVQYFFLQQIGL